MIGSYEAYVFLTGTDPGGPTLKTVPSTSGTLSMDRTWAPAVEAALVLPWSAFDAAALQLIDPEPAQFATVWLVDTVNARQGLWELTVRGYKINAKAGTVSLALRSYESLVQDYGVTFNSIDHSDTALYPTSLSIVRSLVQTAVGADVTDSAFWTAPDPGTIPADYESRFVVPGGNVWEYVLAMARRSPGGTVQHYGYGSSSGDFLRWLLSPPPYSRTPDDPIIVPTFPQPGAGLDPGDSVPVEWTAEKSRDADDYGDAMYAQFPRRTTAGTATLITAGTQFNYEYDYRGSAGATGPLRKQVQVSTRTYPDPTQAGRNARAGFYLSRRVVLDRGQTFTIPLHTGLLPYQVHNDAAATPWMIRSVMHNIGDGTSVVQVTAAP